MSCGKCSNAIFPPPLNGGRPARYERREILNGILYVLRTGLPGGSCPMICHRWDTVYGYLRRWTRQGLWDWMGERLRENARRHLKKKLRPRRRSSTARR